VASAASAASFNIAMKLTGTGLQGSFVAKQARANSLSERSADQVRRPLQLLPRAILPALRRPTSKVSARRRWPRQITLHGRRRLHKTLYANTLDERRETHRLRSHMMYQQAQALSKPL